MDQWTLVNKALPTPNDVHIDAALGDLTVGYIQADNLFVAGKVFPGVNVKHASNSYHIFDRDDFRRDEMKVRGDSAESAGSGFRLSNDSYQALVYALHKDLGKQIMSNMDSALSLDQAAAMMLAQAKLIRQEVHWASKFFVASVWGNDVTPSDLWDDDNSDPIGDVSAGRTEILLETGQRANTMVVGHFTDAALRKHPDIVARLDRGQTSGAADPTDADLAKLFKVERYLVMDAGQTTSAEAAATPVRAFIGGKHALLLHTPAVAGLMVPAAGLTFNWTGLLQSTQGLNVKRWWSDDRSAWRYEIEAAFDMKVTGADLGYMFVSVVS